ncbi:MAG: zf-HC2 domain-containing protein [bacterium]|nr:zf-HC2 domain-containing protein [bacterium]
MNCRRARKHIYDFIDGVIVEQDRLTLEQHLGACGSCEKMASGLSRSLDLLHRVAPEELDENFTWKVRLRLARERNALAKDYVSHTSWVRSWNTRFAFSALSTLVVVIAVGYFSFGPAGVSVDNLPASDAPAEIALEESPGFPGSSLLNDNAAKQVAKRTDSDADGMNNVNRAPRFGPFGGFTIQTVATGPTASPAKTEGALREDMSSELLTVKELKMSDEKRAEQLERMVVNLRTRLEECGCEGH